ncbi:MAG: YPDG domain-containing protein, partial [Peptoniphilus sp. oral taxon 375]|nr:YPDG domain-containing protein [Peptoniphilus sp. oral taxon 375]
MESVKKHMSTRIMAWILSLVMLFTMIPYGAFAQGEAGEDKLGLAPVKGPVGVKEAAPPIESQVGNNSRNAVHAFVGVQTGGDVNLPLANATGQQFKPLEGVRGYFQWFEDGGYVSPIYTAVSDANGRLNIGCTPYLASDGKLIKFDADTTVSAGNERYKFWVEQDTIPKGYQLQYITGEGVVFPDAGLPITQGGSSSNTAKNTHDNWKILFMQKPKAEMHRTDAKETPLQSKSGGYMTGKVSWDYKSGVGGIHWYDITQHTEGAKGVTVRASYLSDYAMKKIYSDEAVLALGGISKPEDIRGPKWTSKLEDDLQKWIKEQVKKEPKKWIAETVTAKTDAEGDYIIQFNGTWGVYKNSDAGLKSYDYKVGDAAGGIAIGNKWTQEQIDRLGSVADSPNNGAFDTAKKNEIKHINYDWLFVSTDGTENLRVMTPYNNNYYTSMNSDWGIHAGWSGTAFGVGVTLSTKCILRSDFVFGPGEIDFHITNYDNEANTAIPGDVAQTSTTGLPYSFTSNKYQIVWYGPDGKVVRRGEPQQPSSTGTIDSAPFDTTGVTKTTEYTAKLHRVGSDGKLKDAIAVDSFTVEVANYVGSRYDVFEQKNENPVKGAAYSAENLPDGLTIDAGNGNISGKPTTAGLYDVKVTASMDDTDEGQVVGKIQGSRTHKYLITDSPLAEGSKGTEYNQKVVPTPQQGYVFKNVKAKFIDGKTIDGLTITGDQISGTPTAKVAATEEEPNVEVTYDVYRKNDKGQEVLIKKGHVDKVPLSIKNGESAQFEPEYTPVNGTVGTQATVAAPTFTDAEGKPATPQDVTYELGQGAPEGAQVNDDGSVTYTPVEADADKAVKIPVVVKYSDGSTDNAKAVINVAKNATTAEKVKELGGLNPQTIKVWKGDKFDWADGVVPADDTNSDAVKALLVDAKITDKQNPARDSSKAGKYEGTLLVTFKDGSTIDVEKQMLIVSDHVVVIDPNNTDPKAPKLEDLPDDKIPVEFARKTGISKVNTNGVKVYAKMGATLDDSHFPTDITFEDGYEGPVTWSPTDHKVTTEQPFYSKRGIFTFRASATKIEFTGDEVIPFEPKDPEKPGNKDDENIPTENPEDNKPIK